MDEPVNTPADHAKLARLMLAYIEARDAMYRHMQAMQIAPPVDPGAGAAAAIEQIAEEHAEIGRRT